MNETTGRGTGAAIAVAALILGALAAGLWFYASPPQREPEPGPATGPAAASAPRDRAAARAKLRRLANESVDHAAATPAGADDADDADDEIVVEFYLAEPEPVAVNDGEPKSADDFYARSCQRESEGDFDGTISDYEKTIRLNPQHAWAHNNLAWLLCTVPDAQYRNGRRAVKLAKDAVRLSKRKEHFIVDTLAAAYAEVGRFTDAVKVQKEALEMLPPDDSKNRVDYKARLELYKSGRPYREERKE